ncbi:MAG: TonB-dependent receptor, partial [Rhodoferax sp.]|nr:TonB-dependent receptor [Rhodoferax sp.]
MEHFCKTTLAIAIASLTHSLAWAQQTLPDVVVSASRADQRSFDAPAAVQSVDRATIEGAGPQVNLSEALVRVPGLTILNRQNYAQDLQLSIRGFGARSAFGIRGIRLLVDGIPATTPDGQGQGSSVALTSTERMEVLRGPLALLYGNSSGGVIQAFTRDAPAVPEFSAQAYTGSEGLRRTDWQYAGRPAGVGLVADYSTFEATGYRANSQTERKQFNAKLSVKATPDTQVNVVFNRFDMPLAQDPLGLTAAQLASNPEQAGNNAVARSVRKVVLQNQLGSSVVHALDAQRSLSGRVYYGTRENLQYQAGIPGVTPTGAWIGLDRAYYGSGVQYNQRLQLAGLPVTWVAGYEFDRPRETRQGGAAALGEKTTTTRDEVNQAENSDVFVQANARIAERWSVVAGARHSTVRFNSSDNRLVDGDGSGAMDFQATSPVLGLSFHANDSLNLYANFGRGFESPTLAEVAYSGSGIPAFNTTIRAARSEHRELGAKWAPNAATRLDLALYQIDSSDEIVVASSSGGNSTFKNAPGTQRTGWELSGSLALNPQWRASLAASQIDAIYSEKFTSGANSVAEGNKIPGIPDMALFAELLWSSEKATPAARTQRGSQVGAELRRSGRMLANDTNTAFADAYTTLALKGSHTWRIGSASLA